MPDRPFNLAIETSGRAGSVTLGCGDELIESRDLPPQQRHTADLMPTIDALCRDHAVAPRDLAELYLSIGPGSFTGLRIGVATAKTLAHVLNIKLVAVPTLDVLAQNAPAPAPGDHGAHLAVCLNLKGQTSYIGFYRWSQNEWQRVGDPALRTMDELLLAAPRPVMILGDPLPEMTGGSDSSVTILPAELAAARSAAVWRLGRAAAKRGAFVDPVQLVPLYVRPVEAEELWKLRHPTAS